MQVLQGFYLYVPCRPILAYRNYCNIMVFIVWRRNSIVALLCFLFCKVLARCYGIYVNAKTIICPFRYVPQAMDTIFV